MAGRNKKTKEGIMKLVIMVLLGVFLLVGTAYGSDGRVVETFGTWKVFERTDVMTGKQSFSAISDYIAPLREMSFPYGDVWGLYMVWML